MVDVCRGTLVRAQVGARRGTEAIVLHRYTENSRGVDPGLPDRQTTGCEDWQEPGGQVRVSMYQLLYTLSPFLFDLSFRHPRSFWGCHGVLLVQDLR